MQTHPHVRLHTRKQRVTTKYKRPSVAAHFKDLLLARYREKHMRLGPLHILEPTIGIKSASKHDLLVPGCNGINSQTETPNSRYSKGAKDCGKMLGLLFVSLYTNQHGGSSPKKTQTTLQLTPRKRLQYCFC